MVTLSVLFRKRLCKTDKIMVPYGMSGTIKEIKAGEFTVEDVVAIITTENGDEEITMTAEMACL